MSFDYLISMKKSTKKPQEGDVFVLQPIKDMFYYGKVIQTNLRSVNSFINGMTLIYIYKHCSKNNKEIPNELENEELLIPPVIVNHQPWRKGYFETVGNVGVTERDRNIDFAFWRISTEKYVDINGQVIMLDRKPKYRSVYGLGSYGIVGKDVQRALGNIV